MTTRKLTAKMVETIKPPAAGQVEHFDSILRGLALRVSARGTKSWVLFYRLAGRQVRQTLGRYPMLELAEARKAAGAALELVDRGEDPRAAEEAAARQLEALIERAEKIQAMTYGAIIAEFIKKHAKPRQRTWRETERILNSLPWHDRPIGSITKADAYDVLDGFVAAGNGAKARVTLAWLKTLWRWACKRDLVDVPMMDAVEIPFERTIRERVYSDDEIRALWQAGGELTAQDRAYLKLLILLGVRKGELAGMRRDQLDDPQRPTLWTVPFELTKSRKSTSKRRVYLVPLPPLARRVLAPLLNRDIAGFVFPGRRRGKPIDPGNWLAKRVRSASGVADWTAHAHRHTLATWAQNAGASEYERGLLLNHAGGATVTAGYSHGYPLEVKAQWLGRWAEHVAATVQPEGAELLA